MKTKQRTDEKYNREGENQLKGNVVIYFQFYG